MTKIKNPCIKLVVKRTQYQEVIINSDEGYQMPESLTQLFEVCEEIKRSPDKHTDENNWSDGDYEVESFNVDINCED